MTETIQSSDSIRRESRRASVLSSSIGLYILIVSGVLVAIWQGADLWILLQGVVGVLLPVLVIHILYSKKIGIGNR
jgi:hypothetical protein